MGWVLARAAPPLVFPDPGLEILIVLDSSFLVGDVAQFDAGGDVRVRHFTSSSTAAAATSQNRSSTQQRQGE